VAEIRAPITGSVRRILVAAGDSVAVDQAVVVIESMKLEIPVEAEVEGTVTRIACAEGDVVMQDDVLLELG
jgi:acetyl-CoA carboxylase biotin carboxyl carrier protein